MSVQVMAANLVDPSNYVTETYSSQLAAFPATNVDAKKRRSKVWRSNGYWEITSGNKAIVFQETIGVNLTANIVVSNYTTDTSFLAAIKTALQAAGSSTYTITRDATTHKLNISSNLSGGGGVFRLICTNGGFTSASTLGFSTGADLTGASNYSTDTLKINTSEWIRWDMGASTNPAAFILVGVRNANIKISPTATVTLQGNGTDVWTSPSFSQAITYNSDSMLYVNTAGFGSYRYWRLLISDVSNTNGYVEVSSIYLGPIFTASRGGVQFPLKTKNLDRSTTVFSESGQPYSDFREKGKSFELNWAFLQYADIETFETYFKNLGTSYPFFISPDPGAAFSSNANFRTRMVRFDSLPEEDLVGQNGGAGFSMTWSLREEL